MFLPQSERPSFIPIQYNWQNYSFIHFNLSVFWYEMGRQKILDWMTASIPEFNLLLICSRMSFWYVSVTPKHLNSATFSNDSLAILIFWLCP
jgi:hypothetical protein